jgi:hemerythrin superfamily protein
MDAIEMLKTDHERVKSLFDQFKGTKDSQKRLSLFKDIRNELEVHALIEEQVFYPAFKNYPDFQDIISRSFEEHADVKIILGELISLQSIDDKYIDRVDELIGFVNEHVLEEETELFPMVRKVMRGAERERLGRHMLALKEESSATAAA